VLDDTELLLPGSRLDIPVDRIDPRLPWYTQRDEMDRAAWSVVSVTPSQSGDSDRHEVTWLCADTGTGDVLAWAIASWSKPDGVFISLTVGTTTLGDQQGTHVQDRAGGE